MEEKSIFDQNRPQYMQQPLQNSTAVLVLGILSIVICFVGFILGIIALVLANKDLRLYNTSPEVYTIASYNNLKAGKICAIIGIIFWALIILFYIIVVAFALSFGFGNSFR
ncbi:MAG: CCC motif membrane protein [Bacteroidota bacterium]